MASEWKRTFPIHSPRVDKIEVLRHGRVRRAKLFYLRDRVGKAAKIRESSKNAGAYAPIFIPHEPHWKGEGNGYQWYPGHMTKSRRQLKEKLRTVDLVIEVLDARAPRKFPQPGFRRSLFSKNAFYILNKADLADENITRSWLRYFGRRISVRFHFPQHMEMWGV